MTVHKAQGSKWGRVVIVDGLNFDHNIPMGKWYYAAYSRAAEQLIILRVKREKLLFSFANAQRQHESGGIPAPASGRAGSRRYICVGIGRLAFGLCAASRLRHLSA